MMFPKPLGRQRDKGYLAWLHTIPCILARAGGCCPGIEANHVGPRPVGRKSDDDQAVPMCPEHHRQWTEHRGYFADWSRPLRAVWAMWAIEQTQARHARAADVEEIPA